MEQSLQNLNEQADNFLLQAAALLEQGQPWTKHRFFNQEPDECAMCAHGAIMYCANTTIKERVDQKIITKKDYGVIAESAINTAMGPNNTSYIAQYGAWGLAHYKAAKSGLTFLFNDHYTTSKEQVIAKLKEAASTTLDFDYQSPTN